MASTTFTVKIENDIFKINKTIFSLCCTFFAANVAGNYIELGEGYSSNAFRLFVDIIEGSLVGKANNIPSMDAVYGLFKLNKLLGCKKIFKICQKYILENAIVDVKLLRFLCKERLTSIITVLKSVMIKPDDVVDLGIPDVVYLVENMDHILSWTIVETWMERKSLKRRKSLLCKLLKIYPKEMHRQIHYLLFKYGFDPVNLLELIFYDEIEGDRMSELQRPY